MGHRYTSDVSLEPDDQNEGRPSSAGWLRLVLSRRETSPLYGHQFPTGGGSEDARNPNGYLWASWSGSRYSISWRLMPGLWSLKGSTTHSLRTGLAYEMIDNGISLYDPERDELASEATRTSQFETPWTKEFERDAVDADPAW